MANLVLTDKLVGDTSSILEKESSSQKIHLLQILQWWWEIEYFLLKS